jgi:hypothetical protein
MRKFAAFEKQEKQDDGTIKVWGYASSEAVDADGDVIKATAMAAALPDYMKFGNIREMHQPLAAGVAIEAEVLNDGRTWLGAHVVDPTAVKKIETGVYKGFSIGGAATEYEPGTKNVITGLVLNEISLVDRPANPDAVFELWKAQGMTTPTPTNPADQVNELADILNKGELSIADVLGMVKDAIEKKAGKAAGGNDDGAGGSPADPASNDQIDTAKADGKKDDKKDGEDEEDDEMEKATKASDSDKPYGDVEYADGGKQDDGKKRYPIDTAEHIRAAWNYINKQKNADKYSSGDLKEIKDKIIAAWKDKIDSEGPPSASEDGKDKSAANGAQGAVIEKSLYGISDLACTLSGLNWQLCSVEWEEQGEDDTKSPTLALFTKWMDDGMALLETMVGEEIAEWKAGKGIELALDSGYMQKCVIPALVKAGKLPAAPAAGTEVQPVVETPVVTDPEAVAKSLAAAQPIAKAAVVPVHETPEFKEALEKAVKAQNGELMKTVDSLVKRLEIVESQPAPAKGVLRAVSKSADGVSPEQAAPEVTPVTYQGQEDPVATALKKSLQNPGTMLVGGAILNK